ELMRRRLEVHVGPARYPFHRRDGYEFGDPRWLDVIAHKPELGLHVATPRVEIGAAGPAFRPGDEVVGQVSVYLPAPLRARAVRLVLRTQESVGVLPTIRLEREAVVGGQVWEG